MDADRIATIRERADSGYYRHPNAAGGWGASADVNVLLAEVDRLTNQITDLTTILHVLVGETAPGAMTARPSWIKAREDGRALLARLSPNEETA